MELAKPAGADEPQKVAVASNNVDIVAIIADDSEVYASQDGGLTWSDLGSVQESGQGAAIWLGDIDISITGIIAVAGMEAGPLANIWRYSLGMPSPEWTETNSLTGFVSADRAVAVAFSPNFPIDATMLAITEDDDGGPGSDNIRLQALISIYWDMIEYPLLVDDDGITGIDSASLSLPSNFNGSLVFSRDVFIGLAVSGDVEAAARSGAYHINNTTSTRLIPFSFPVRSVAYNNTDLLVGGYNSADIWHLSSPLEGPWPQLPTVSGSLLTAFQGQTKVVVEQIGDEVIAGTSGDNSAVYVSSNSGQSSYGNSFIDTEIVNIDDFTVSADGSRVYLVTSDGASSSVWRKRDADWQRVYLLDNSNGYIMRTSIDTPDVVWLADRGAQRFTARWMMASVGPLVPSVESVVSVTCVSRKTIPKFVSPLTALEM